jgi:alkyl sulfatase BDS1-like metallo-beta-lactamase superfamily hydrolase
MEAVLAVRRNPVMARLAHFRQGGSSPFFASSSTSDVFDVLATRLDDEKASSVDLKLEVIFPERGDRTYVTVRHGVLIHQPIDAPGPVDATLTLSRADFLARVLDGVPLPASTAGDVGGAKGNLAALDRLAGLLETPKANFAIVTPHP